jgi:hypothetical protein
LLELCTTSEEARAVLDANPVVAQKYAESTQAYASLSVRDPAVDELYTAVKRCADPTEAAALLATADPKVYAAVAWHLCLDERDQYELGKRYHELILGEKEL